MRNILRRLMYRLGIHITRNQKYDRYTELILQRLLRPDSNCLDIGCHKGEILEFMVRYAPAGYHTGAEPIPVLYARLEKKFSGNPRVTMVNKALGDANAVQEFNWVKNAPAYSGLRQRSYSIPNPDIEKIQVEVVRLDSLQPAPPKLDFIKVCAEGAEMPVLRGAAGRIASDRPFVLFKFGLGASEYYDTAPEEVYDYFQERGYRIYRMKTYINNGKPYRLEEFSAAYTSNSEYYFLACPAS